MFAQYFKAEKAQYHSDGTKCSSPAGCDKAHFNTVQKGEWATTPPPGPPRRDAEDDARARQRLWDGAERITKADIGSSDIALVGRLNPEQAEAKPAKKPKKMRRGAAFDHGIPPRTDKKDSTRPLPRMDTGLSAPILTGSFAAGKGQSTSGYGGDRFDPTSPGKTPVVKDPISRDQLSAPVGPTYVGAFESAKNLKKKVKVEHVNFVYSKLEGDMTAGKVLKDSPDVNNPATLGKGIAQTVKVISPASQPDAGKVKHYMVGSKHVATAHSQSMWERPNARGTRGQSEHHSLTLHPDGPEGDKKVGPWLRGAAPHPKQVSDLIADTYQPSPGT